MLNQSTVYVVHLTLYKLLLWTLCKDQFLGLWVGRRLSIGPLTISCFKINHQNFEKVDKSQISTMKT